MRWSSSPATPFALGNAKEGQRRCRQGDEVNNTSLGHTDCNVVEDAWVRGGCCRRGRHGRLYCGGGCRGRDDVVYDVVEDAVVAVEEDTVVGVVLDKTCRRGTAEEKGS